MPQGPLPAIFSIPRNSNLRYLPLVYFLPENMIDKFPILRSLPRRIRTIMYDKHILAVINNDSCSKEIMDAAAALVFPHFGFGDWIEHYTCYCPVWKLSYYLPVWSKLLEEEIGWGLQALLLVPISESIPFFNSKYIDEVMGRVVKRGVAEEGWQPILDAVREMPSDEDFEKWDTNVRKDFLRKWYHTRSKRVQTVSLEVCIENEDNSIHGADIFDLEERVESEDFCQRFMVRLSKKDMKILDLRLSGFTYEEIADKFGYKNHSGVIKRMQSITKAFIQYQAEQQ